MVNHIAWKSVSGTKHILWKNVGGTNRISWGCPTSGETDCGFCTGGVAEQYSIEVSGIANHEFPVCLDCDNFNGTFILSPDGDCRRIYNFPTNICTAYQWVLSWGSFGGLYNVQVYAWNGAIGVLGFSKESATPFVCKDTISEWDLGGFDACDISNATLTLTAL
jgi:hypothetical protein